MQDVTFLVVDDCQTVRNLVRNTLVNRLGSENVYTAENGKEALEILAARRIDIIISDWEMPQMCGVELLSNVRASENHKNIPFIMMSARGAREDVIAAIQKGVSQYVVKPCSADKLEDAIHKSWNAAQKRGAVRLSALPEHTVRFDLGAIKLPGQVKNISQSGMLVQLPYNRELNLFKSYGVELEIFSIGNEGNMVIDPLIGTLVRLVAVDIFTRGVKTCQVALRFNRDLLSDKVKYNLDYLLDKLGAIDAEVIADN